MFESIQADKALVQLIARETPPILDVRSEGEFAESHVPGFTNIPILDNSERHQVGLTYKNEGNEAAVKLGYALPRTAANQNMASVRAAPHLGSNPPSLS